MGAYHALKRLLVDDVILPLAEMHEKKFCVLMEIEAGYKFTIRGLPDDTLIIKSDRFPTTKDVFFKSDHMECKRADYVLVSESEKIIMFFELKRSTKTASMNDVIAQLKGSKCVMDYCELISAAFLGEYRIFNGYTLKYYRLIAITSRKRPFKNQQHSNNSPEDARTITDKNISYGGLLV